MEDRINSADAMESHREYVSWFESSEEATRQARELSERCWDYYDGNQLSEEELAALNKRRQPPVVKNWIKREVDTLVGLEKSQRTDPRAFPRSPQHEQDAEAATDSLRYIIDNEDYDQKRSCAWLDLIVKGYGGLQFVMRPNPQTNELDIGIENTPWDRMWFDPFSSRADFSDARYLGLVVWKDMDVAKSTYGDSPDAVAALEASTVSQSNETFDDKPRETWYDSKRKRIRVVQMYHQTPQGWAFCEFTKGGKLREGVSPFVDEHGQPDHPFVWRSAYIDRDNNRYGLVKEPLDIQDEINKRSSKLLHLANSRQSWSQPGVVQDEVAFRRKVAQPDAHLSAEGQYGIDWGFVDNQGDVVGHANLLQEAKQEMNLAGPNPSLSGESQSARSGRALQTEQQASLMQLGGLLDALRDMDKRVYRKAWCQVRKFWTAPKWIRVTDDERNVRFVGLNQPQIDPQTGQLMAMNQVAQIDVDIIIEDAPDQVTLAGETFTNLVDLARVGVQLPPQAYIAAAPNLRNKDQILEMVEQMQANPQAQMAAQLEMASKEADIKYTQARTLKERTQAIENATDAAATQAEQQARMA